MQAWNVCVKMRKHSSKHMRFWYYSHMGFDARKTVFGGLQTKKSADQPAHPRRLISAFVIRLLESIVSKLATSEISIFQLALCS